MAPHGPAHAKSAQSVVIGLALIVAALVLYFTQHG
jgi:hypothetical protein